MTIHKNNLYEGMFILSATLSEEARGKALERVLAEITSRNGEVQKIHEQGRSKLAYEIEGHREGYYYVVYFSVNPAAIGDMRREYHLNEDLIRFMMLRTDKIMESIEFKALAEQQ